MGLFHLKCVASGLGIVTENVALILVARDAGAWVPVAPPIRGAYDTYGSIDQITMNEVVQRIVSGFMSLEVSAEEPTLRGCLEEIRQGVILNSVGNETALVRAQGKPLGFVMVLSSMYDAVVTMGRAANEHVALEAMPFEALLPNALAAALTEDTRATRNALINLQLFRSWFSGSWEPVAVGVQLSSRDLRGLAEKARVDFAKWPALVKAIEAYQRDSTRV